MAEKVAQKELMLYTHIDAALPDILIGDPSRFSQVLLNLINNAVKFTASGHILLRISCISQQGARLDLRCEVIDSGIGIDFATSSKLFQPFIQADSSTTRQFGGTGLGLSICRRLVEAMHGEIGVESKIGYGSTFWFTAELGHTATSTPRRQFNATAFTDQAYAATALEQCFGAALHTLIVSPEQQLIWPTTPPELCILDVLDPSAAEQIQQQIKTNYPHSKLIRLVPLRALATSRLENAEQINVPRPIRQRLLRNAAEQLLNPSSNVNTAQPVQTQQHDLPILLVEDNPINQRVASLILQKMGYHVTIAGNGKEGLTLLEQHDYALILMDCQMPVMDGFSATRAIRALDSAKAKHPIVALTSNAFQEDRDACFAAGMDDFITKPVTTQALNAVITRWVKKELITDEASQTAGI
jgi:two-component system sensor histidine kinase/response regulator